jgi:hypothetical protein
MCASCGCGKLEDTHGDDRNLTMTQVKEAADAAGIDPKEAARNITNAANQGNGTGHTSGQQGQPGTTGQQGQTGATGQQGQPGTTGQGVGREGQTAGTGGQDRKDR